LSVRAGCQGDNADGGDRLKQGMRKNSIRRKWWLFCFWERRKRFL